MSGYTQLTDDELNCEIAKRLGYSLQKGTYHSDGVDWYEWITPEYEALTTELSAKRAARHLPAWSIRVEDALELFPEPGNAVILTRYSHGGWNAYAEVDGTRRAFERDADMPARALCLTWLAWQDNSHDT